MKTGYLFAVCFGLLASPLAWAGEHDHDHDRDAWQQPQDNFGHHGQSIDPTDLGTLDAIISVCGEIDGSNVHAYRELRDSVLGRVSDDRLDRFHQLDQYRRSFTQTENSLRADPQDWLRYACRSAINNH